MGLWVNLEVRVDVGSSIFPVEMYSRNITHNMGRMAKAAGIYKEIWRPDEIWNCPIAADITEHLWRGLLFLTSWPSYFSLFAAPNGYGRYTHFVDFVTDYLENCERYPLALIRVGR